MRQLFCWLARWLGLNFRERARATIKAEEATAASRSATRSWLNSDH